MNTINVSEFLHMSISPSQKLDCHVNSELFLWHVTLKQMSCKHKTEPGICLDMWQHFATCNELKVT